MIEVNDLKKNYGNYAMLLKALSDETRVKIFDMLAHGELCACKILEEFNITQPTLSYHMKILCESNLVDSRRDGVWMRYSINRNNLERIRDLFDSIGVENGNNNENTK
jgi:ArsR family transcriptional regulator